ncbi:DUF6318 family protein [Psychromicrobium lacuslunae]|nr:DUF6318 family protein [Psychromicrobium lacuslunae]
MSAKYRPATVKSAAQNVPVPIKPSQADEFSEQGLKAFAVYWYNVYNYMIQTGKVGLIGASTKGDCQRCQIVFKDTEDWYRSGNWRMGGQLIITHLQPPKIGFAKAANGMYQYLIQYNKLAGGYITSGHKVEKAYPAVAANGDLLNATYENGTWLVFDIGKIG